MTRLIAIGLLAALGALGALGALATVAGGEDPPAQTVTVTVTRTEKVRVLSSYQGRRATWWARRTWYWKRRSIALKRTLLDRPQVQEAINLACITYSVSCGLMWQLARCESRLYAGAKNPRSDASGLFQMLYPSTWRTTPYWPLSVWSPYANAMAAAHMLDHGRRGEWEC